MPSQTENIRWDAVVSLPVVSPSTASQPPVPEWPPGSNLDLRIWLFGGLKPRGAENPICLSVPAPTTVSDILAILEQWFGMEAATLARDDHGGLSRCWRLFVDGYPVEQLEDAIRPLSLPAQVEIILLSALEGG